MIRAPMALPFDGWSVAAILVTAACLGAAARSSLPSYFRLSLIVLAAIPLRLDPAWQESLHVWDESAHAVVAKNLVSHPLVPTLYDQPVLAAPTLFWTETEVWLHKPPLALWLMALSLWTFGVHAIALRLPSLILSTLAVVTTFAIGRRVFDARVGLLAAAFQTVNGLLVTLSSGRRVADHVDTALVLIVELGVLAIVSSTGERRVTRAAWLAGIAAGLGMLTKSFPALVIVVVALAAWTAAYGFGRAAGLVARVVVATAVVCLPWIVYTHAGEVLELQRRGVPIVIFERPGETVTPPPAWQAVVVRGR